MCPFCLLQSVAIVSGSISAGGLGTYLLRKSQAWSRARGTEGQTDALDLGGLELPIVNADDSARPATSGWSAAESGRVSGSKSPNNPDHRRMHMTTETLQNARIVSREDWLLARQEFLTQEKQLTHQRDAVNASRRKLPWVRIEKEYIFDTPQGKKTLGDLFAGRSQLIIYHFMWRRDLGNGCVGCSFLADHVDGANLHLAHHDVSFVAVSRAPLPVLEAYKQRMGWRFPWVSSVESDFNFDFHVSFTPEELASGEVFYNYRMTKASIEELSGLSVFYQSPDGEIFHTYSSYGRGNEEVLGTYMYLDLTPNGRNENGPYHSLGDWVRPHDQYDVGGSVDPMGGYSAGPPAAPECRCHEAGKA